MGGKCHVQLAAQSQGTMNNITFGDRTFEYYETLAEVAGAAARLTL
jgi:N-methylhydantoinase B/oxoprolinase/acetone carboxylase alpha subunit